MNPRKVELIKQAQNYQLTVDGKPFYIKGAGLDLGIDNIKSLASHGGNAFRTWRVENGEQSALEILDEAHQHGLMVCMGLEVARERHGFDYDDKKAVTEQLEQIKQDILALKNHPALLMWGIGNELNLRHTNPKVWDAVNDLSKMIHQVDPNHPTTTMLAGAEPKDIVLVAKRCTDVDLLSFQVYGEIDQLPRFLAESKFKGAYTVSEWGATGHWESPLTDWKRPVEANSSDKALSLKNAISTISPQIRLNVLALLYFCGDKNRSVRLPGMGCFWKMVCPWVQLRLCNKYGLASRLNIWHRWFLH